MNGDCISRQAAIDALHKTIYKFFEVAATEDFMTDKDELLLSVNKAVAAEIKALSPVFLQSGEWINHSDHDAIECSCCGKAYAWDVFGRDTANYCPNCGAKMRKEGEQ